MAYIGKIPNDQRNQVLYIAPEAIPGQAATTGFTKVLGSFDFPPGPAALSDFEDATGTFMSDDAPARGSRVISGNFSAPGTYEALPIWNRMAIEAGATPDSGSGPDYTYVQDPALTEDDVDTFTVITGVPGNLFQATGVRIGEYNLAVDKDNADGFWQLSGTATAATFDQMPGSFEGVVTAGTTTTLTMTGATWTIDEWATAFVFNQYGTGTGPVRKIVSNTADTLTVSTPFEIAPAAGDVFRIAAPLPAGIADLAEEKIKNGGTKVWILPKNGTPTATNNIKNRIISANVNVALNLDPKAFLEHEDGESSGIYGRGALKVTGSIRLEFDRYDEIAAMKALDEMLIRIEKEGSDLGGGVRKLERVEVTRAVWNEMTRDTRNNNLTQTLSFRGYLATPPLVFTTRNGLATLS